MTTDAKLAVYKEAVHRADDTIRAQQETIKTLKELVKAQDDMCQILHDMIGKQGQTILELKAAI